MALDIYIGEGRPQAPRQVPEMYYRSYKWYRPGAGWVLREEWFTWDGRGYEASNFDLKNFKERLLTKEYV